MFMLFLALFVGIVFGIVAGLLPGLHPNNTIPIILGMEFIFGPLATSIILVSSGVVNSFINFIPSVLLGAPEESTVLSVLPGHKLLLEGRGYEAIKLSVIGCLGGVVFSVLTLPFFAIFIPALYGVIRYQVHWLLIIVIGYMVLNENRKNRFYGLSIFLLSGILGLVVLNNYPDSSLFPLLTGLFGIPSLIIAINEKTKLPDVLSLEEDKIEKRSLLSSISIGSIGGVIAGLLPGLGSTQSTVLTQNVFRREESERGFLVSIGAITIADIIYSIFALWLISNPRSGISVGVSKLLEVGLNEVLIFISIIIIASGIGAYATLKLAGFSLGFLKKVDYSRLCLYTTIFLMVLTLVFSGFIGLLILIVASAVGMIPNLKNIRRTYSKGCLILPPILFFAGINLL